MAQFAFGSIFLVLALAVSNAAADALPENLSRFAKEDVCGITASTTTIDNVKDDEITIKVNQVINKENTLYGYPFYEVDTNPDLKDCVVYFGYTIDSFTIGSEYIYSLRFTGFMTPIITNTVETGSGSQRKLSIKISYPEIYSIGAYGKVTGRENLIARLSDTAKQQFEDFLLDWRKSH